MTARTKNIIAWVGLLLIILLFAFCGREIIAATEPLSLDTKTHKVVSPTTIDFAGVTILNLPITVPVTSVFGRTGAITAQSSDYATFYAPLAAALPTGGTTGQVLTKTGATDYAATWQTPTTPTPAPTPPVTSVFTRTGAITAQSGDYAAFYQPLGNYVVDPLTTKGDLIVRGVSSVPSRLGVGANGTVLTADSGQPLGMSFQTFAAALPAGGAAGQALTKVNATDYNTQWTTLGGGSGTVTSFSAGDLSPLFTTSVANATTAPALTFSLSAATSNTWFGNSGGLGTPAFNAAGALTAANDTNVTLTLGGTPTTALLKAASITAGWSGTLAVARGGTGAATAAAGTVFANNTTGTAAPAFVTNPRITALPNLTGNGFVKTSSGNGTLSVDTSTYLTAAVTNVATTSPITGGPITDTGTIGWDFTVANTWTGGQQFIPTSAVTNSEISSIVLGARSSGTPAAGFGSRVIFLANTNGAADRTIAWIGTQWSDAADATRSSYMRFVLTSNATNAERMRLHASGGLTIQNLGVDPGGGVMNAAGYKVNGNPISSDDLATTTTNDDAAAGEVGQTVSTAIAQGSQVTYTTGQTKNLTSISLTAGDWDVRGAITWFMNGVPANTVYTDTAGISTTTNTFATDGLASSNAFTATTAASSGFLTCALPPRRIKLASTTTVYLVGQAASFTGGAVGAFGYIEARRVR